MLAANHTSLALSQHSPPILSYSSVLHIITKSSNLLLPIPYISPALIEQHLAQLYGRTCGRPISDNTRLCAPAPKACDIQLKLTPIFLLYLTSLSGFAIPPAIHSIRSNLGGVLTIDSLVWPLVCGTQIYTICYMSNWFSERSYSLRVHLVHPPPGLRHRSLSIFTTPTRSARVNCHSYILLQMSWILASSVIQTPHRRHLYNICGSHQANPLHNCEPHAVVCPLNYSRVHAFVSVNSHIRLFILHRDWLRQVWHPPSYGEFHRLQIHQFSPLWILSYWTQSFRSPYHAPAICHSRLVFADVHISHRRGPGYWE